MKTWGCQAGTAALLASCGVSGLKETAPPEPLPGSARPLPPTIPGYCIVIGPPGTPALAPWLRLSWQICSLPGEPGARRRGSLALATPPNCTPGIRRPESLRRLHRLHLIFIHSSSAHRQPSLFGVPTPRYYLFPTPCALSSRRLGFSLPFVGLQTSAARRS